MLRFKIYKFLVCPAYVWMYVISFICGIGSVKVFMTGYNKDSDKVEIDASEIS